MQILIYGTTSHIDRLENILREYYKVEVINLSKIINMKKNRSIFNKFQLIFEIIINIYKSKLIYTIFCGNFSIFNFFVFFIARILNKKIINHWIGTDILIAKKNKNKTKIMQLFINYNFSGSKLLHDELYDIGIKSEIVPIILQDISHKISKMPSSHAILVYLPEGREEFYGYSIVLKLIKYFKSIDFYIIANNKIRINEKNVILLGNVSVEKMNEVYDRISILLRIPEHDGLSLMVLEALAKGKYVIYKYEFPYTYQARNYIEAKEKINLIISHNPPIVNSEASEFISKSYTHEQYLSKIMEKINE